ncbi:Fic family protein [Pontibaca salina]|uniref:Fic family protein n=1 Tax=Pontibaca salina TaxID=2795731 RepID=A0A934M2L5_9RHOB|nr:Fic family protein [Pontibaca salina]MBI6630746.1 Fic family protein [Pontibaca salina]
MYIWEQSRWPSLTWDEGALAAPLVATRHEQGKLLGKMEAVGFDQREEAMLQTLTQDIVKTSEIEGENLDTQQVRSSIARRLGIDIGALPPVDRNVEGIVDVMLDATRKYQEPVTAERLFAWHGALFPTGRSGLSKIRVGDWRDDSSGPLQVVSGSYGRERIHFSAPPADRVPGEMTRFLDWLNAPSEMDPVIKAAIAHFWFVTIHPFEDGNGRIARAIADLALARSESVPHRYYSMSTQIQKERKAYYDLLEKTQKGDLDITSWILWFLVSLRHAIQEAETTVANVLAKARFWGRASQFPLNERQIKILNRLFDGFEGKLTSSKWAKIADCSQDTAGRDIAALVDRGLLRRGEGGGRNTHYEICLAVA